jgi:hypothetical protein
MSGETLNYVDPEYIDDIDMTDTEESVKQTEPTMNPNKKRRSEILDIMAVSSIGNSDFIIKKIAQDALGLSAVSASRVAFNILTRIPDMQFGTGNPVPPVGTSGVNVNLFDTFNVGSFIAELDAHYSTLSVSNGTITGGDDPFFAKTYSSLDSATPVAIKNPHALMYAFIKVEEKHNNGVFECNSSNPIFAAIAGQTTDLQTAIEDAEDAILEYLAFGVVAGAVGGIAGSRFSFVGSRAKLMVGALISILPGVNSPQEFYKKYVLGGKGLYHGYEYCVDKDMCNSKARDYSHFGDVVKASVGESIMDIAKLMAGNIRDFLRGFGTIVKDIKKSVTLGVEDFREELAPRADAMDYGKMDDLNKGIDYHEVIVLGSIAVNYFDKKSNYWKDPSSISGLLSDSSSSMDFAKYEGVTLVIPTASSNFDQNYFNTVYNAISKDSKNFRAEEIYLNNRATLMVGDQNMRGDMSKSIISASSEKEVVNLKPCFSVEERELTENRADGATNDYSLYGSILSLDSSTATASFKANYCHGFSSDGKYIGSFDILHNKNGVAILKLREVGSESYYSHNLENISNEQSFHQNWIYLNTKLSRKVDDVKSRVFDWAEAQDKYDEITGIQSIDYASVYRALRDFAVENGYVKEDKMDKVVTRRTDRANKREEREQRRIDKGKN